jgi:hypothetical protein
VRPHALISDLIEEDVRLDDRLTPTLATMLVYRDEHDRMATQRRLTDVVAATLVVKG